MRKLTHVLGVPFDAVTMEEAVAKAKKLLKEEGQHIICTPNPEIVMEAQAATDETFYFFGGAPGVASAAARKMMKKYPGLKVVGVHNGYFDEKEEKRIIQDIKTKSPSILLVGLGAPKQEKWIYDNIRLTGAKVAIGVGGSFDVMAGNVKRAPKIFRKLGLEWFHRLITQPTRWKRMMRLPKFALTVLKTKGR